MKEETTDQDLQILLTKLEIDHPKRICPQGNKIYNICINPTCEGNAMFCLQEQCSSCFKKHLRCEHVYFQAFTQLLQKRMEGQKDFVISVIEIEKIMIKEIQKNTKNLIERLYHGDFQAKYTKLIESIYYKKEENIDIKSSYAEEFYGLLKRCYKDPTESNHKRLQTFRKQVLNITQNLNKRYSKLVEDYIANSKLTSDINILSQSTIIPRDNQTYQNFVKECFVGAKRFELIFRASQHLFSAAKFHQKCDNINHTFTVIKSEFGKIFGGYTPLKWNQSKDSWIHDKQYSSFLMSFDLQQKMKLNKNTYAIGNYGNAGPAFGGLQTDIFINDKCNINDNYVNFPKSYNCNGIYQSNQKTYTALTGVTNGNNFKVVEYQVYKVIW